MQVVDFWIPYNFLSLLLFTVGTQHLTDKKKKISYIIQVLK